MNSFAYYNGKFDRRENISIPLSDRALFFGDAVYDVAMGCYDRILWEDEHLKRLLDNAKAIGIVSPYSLKYLSELIHEVVIKSMVETYAIYIQLSRGKDERHHAADNCKVNLLITVDEITPNLLSPPMSLMTHADNRYGYCNIKTVNLLPAVLASTKAEATGYDEAVFIKDGTVTECAKSNISILKQGRLITHPKSTSILPGITRQHLLASCNKLDIPVLERSFTTDEMFSADEIIVTSSTKLCRRVNLINEKSVGGKAIALFNNIRNQLNHDYLILSK